MSLTGGLRRTVIATAVAAMIAGAAGSAQAEDIVLRMAAPDWFPTRALQDLANKNYKAPSGNNVKIEVDFIPWGSFYERLAASLTSGEEKYQMAVSDSQWLGAFVEGGYYLKLNDLIEADADLKAILADIHPNLLRAYSTYPHGTENYYGFPQMPDTMVAYYRTDLFCDEAEGAAFQEKYGYKLPCSYEEMSNADWTQVRDFGEFFTRSAGENLAGQALEQDFYGLGFQYSKVYDFVTMMANPFFWQWGGGIWDETQEPDAQAMGVVNSAENKEALQAFMDLIPFNPPGTVNQGIDEINNAFAQGQVAYINNWAAVGEPINDPATSVVSDKYAVAQPPGKRKDDGSLERYWNVGGQPFVLTTWNSDEVVSEALDFVKWWLSDETQTEFTKLGGSSAMISVHSRDDYPSYRPWNRAFVDSLGYQRDLWHIPEFFELLTQKQEKLNAVVAGQISADEALESIAEFQDEVLRDAGRID